MFNLFFVQIKHLENTVHFIQPLFESVKTKILFNNFLLMNNEHQTGISLTFFGIKYRSYAMLEVKAFRLTRHLHLTNLLF